MSTIVILTNMNDWIDNGARLTLEANRMEKKFAPSINDEGYREYHASAVARDQTNQKKLKQISHFQASLKNIASTLRNMENEKFDCVYFQNLLEKFESKLSFFKSTMAKEYEELAKSEQVLFGDLETLDEHVARVMTQPSTSFAAGGITSAAHARKLEEVKNRNDKISAHKAEIGSIERKLNALGNRLGGWDPRDHDIFIRVWTQCVGPIAGASSSTGGDEDEERNDDESNSMESRKKAVLDLGSKLAYVLRKRLIQAIQMKSEEEIEEHLLWFVEVEALLRRKKEILSVWKREKEKERPDPMSATSADSCSSPNRRPASSSAAVSDRKRELNKQKLEKWQKEKDEEKRKKEAQEKRRQQEQKRQHEREHAERQQSNRVLVQNWVEERKAKEQAIASTKPSPSKVSNASLEELRKKREEEIDKAKMKRNKINAARAASTGRLQRQQKLAETATDPAMKARVKSKLHEPTKVYLANRLTAEDLDAREQQRNSGGAHDGKIASGGYDLKFTGRAIPAWTRGVM